MLYNPIVGNFNGTANDLMMDDNSYSDAAIAGLHADLKSYYGL
jgi:hypothetical protein